MIMASSAVECKPPKVARLFMNRKEYEKGVFSLLRRYLEEHDYASLQKESYDFFLHHRLQKIIEEEPILEVAYKKNEVYRVEFGQVFVDKPYVIDEKREMKYILPSECRIRDFTYSSVVSINIHASRILVDDHGVEQEVLESKTHFKQFLARIPMMVGCSKCNTFNMTRDEWQASGECKYDAGGYFLIKGKERVLVAQERINYNIVYVFEPKKSLKYKNVAEIRSISEETGHSVLVSMKTLVSESRVYLSIPYLNQDIALGYVLRAYGASPQEIEELLKSQFDPTIMQQSTVLRHYIRSVVKDANFIGSQHNAILFMTQHSTCNVVKERRVAYIHQILTNEVFPHLRISSSTRKKICFLGHMFARLMHTEIGVRKHDDRDHISNKRLEVSGILVGELFRTLYKRFVRSIESQVMKRQDILLVISRFNVITQGLRHCFATGNWGIPKSNYVRTGVSQVLNRLTFNATLSHLNRVLIPIGKEGKNTKIRQLHASQFGFFDAHETPEGHCLAAPTMIRLSNGARTEWSISDLCHTSPLQKCDLSLASYDCEAGSLLRTPNRIRNSFVSCNTVWYRVCVQTPATFRLEATALHPVLCVIPNPAEDTGLSVDWCLVQDLQEEEMLICLSDQSVRQKIQEQRRCDSAECAQSMDFLNKYLVWRGGLEGYRSAFLPTTDISIGDVSTEIKDMNRRIEHLRIDLNIHLRTHLSYDQGIFTLELFFASPKDEEQFWTKWYFFHCDNTGLDKAMELHLRFVCAFGRFPAESDARLLSEWKRHPDLWFVPFTRTQQPERNRPCFDLQMEAVPNFIANGFVVHNSAGVVKNLSWMTRITLRFDSTIHAMILEGLSCLDLSFETAFSDKHVKVFLNGDWLGTTVDARGILHQLLELRRKRRIPPSVSISHQEKEKEILIFSDEGRMVRPFFSLRNLPTREDLEQKSWNELVDEQKIVYLDSYEIEKGWIAMSPLHVQDPSRQEFCEIHPSLMMGICTSLIPFPEHTQAPRLCYEASMGKQAIGIYASTNNYRTDTIVHVLQNPERPIVQTHMAEIVGYNDLPCGNNLIVAIASYSGFNQEDSLIFNKSSIERGVFRSFSFRTLVVEEKKRTNYVIESICMPPITCQNRNYNYSKLDSSGIVKTHVFVGVGDVLIGKVLCKQGKTTGADEMSDHSVVIKNGEEGYVDRIFVTVSHEGYKMVKIKIRTLKILEVGDKLASRNAQKGVIGSVMRAEDMPFILSSGMIPDLIMNPHAIPSRMTINQLLESASAKAALHQGKFRYATGFTHHSENIFDELCEELLQCGFQKSANERMVNGMTGEMLHANVFVGPTYYLRLKHLVSSKIHARNNGSVQTLCRQPLEGRSKDGGLRFGEMEKDAFRGDTAVSLICGLSVRIDQMKRKGFSVLSWSQQENGICSSVQTEYLEKGMRECYEVVLEDGRKIYPSIRHPFLTHENRWVRANDLVAGQSILKTSLQFPLMDIDQDIQSCQGWSLWNFTAVDRVQNYLEALAFVRLTGYYYYTDDGEIPRNGLLCVEHILDVKACVEDIRRLCPDFTYDGGIITDTGYYTIRLPHDLVKNINTHIGTTTKEPTLPEFVLKQDCPLPIVREFLGGLFGRNCHGPSLVNHREETRGQDSSLTSITFSRSTVSTPLPALHHFFQDLQQLLSRMGITNVTIQNSPDEQNILTLHINVQDLISFSENIGLRYCLQESQRLQVAVSYQRLCENAARQHDWILNRVHEITIQKENHNDERVRPTTSVKAALAQAVQELEQTEPLIHSCAIPTMKQIASSPSFPTAEEYLQTIGAFEWFLCHNPTKRHPNSLQTLNLRVLSVKSIGEYPVYDIQVDRTKSFVAEGVVAHNCMISHGVAAFLKERLFDMSDPFSVPVCCQCGFTVNRHDICAKCSSTQTTMVEIPYACKLLFQELVAMGIRISLLPVLPHQ